MNGRIGDDRRWASRSYRTDSPVQPYPFDDLIPRLSAGARRVAGAHPEPLARGAAC